MAYKSIKKLIENLNKQYENGSITSEEYSLAKADYTNKMDVFLANNRLTDKQYEELMAMFVEDKVEE